MAIKKLQKNFTTPEQSKRLLELGVPADSADCCFYLNTNYSDKPHILYKKLSEKQADYDSPFSSIKATLYPCWSVGKLMEMWEICVGVKFDRWSKNGVLLPLIEDCIEHIEFALNPYTKVDFDFSKFDD